MIDGEDEMKKILVLCLLLIGVAHSDPQGIYEDRCQACHGAYGMSYAMTKSVPIANLTQKEILKRLNAYKFENRSVYGMGELMKGQLSTYNNEELEGVADYISELSNNRVDTIVTKGLKLEIATLKQIERRDNYFIVEIKLTNSTWHEGAGGVTLSFPQYEKLDGKIVSKSFSSVDIFQPPKKMYNKISKTLKKNRYLSIEGWEKTWKKNTTHFIKLKLRIPKKGEIFQLQVRGVFMYQDKKEKHEVFVPNKEGLEIDQQGYVIQSIGIPIK